MVIIMSGDKKRFMGADKIRQLYKSGERDFSGVICVDGNFEDMDLRGIIFKKANLGFCSFRNSNLQGADFSHANLEWSNFTRADIRGATFEKARLVWSKLNEAQIESTNMRCADLSESLAFNTTLRGGADLAGAIIDTVALHPGQLTPEMIQKLNQQLGRLEGSVSYDVWLFIRMSANAMIENMAKQTAGEERSCYDKSAGAAASLGSYSGGTHVGHVYAAPNISRSVNAYAK